MKSISLTFPSRLFPRAASAPSFAWRMLACLLFGIALLLAGKISHARDLSAIKSSGTLIVAIPDVRTPPFFFDDHGELKGLDIDLAKSIAESLGVRISFNRDAKSFNDAVQLVAAGRADMAAAKISRTLARAQTVLFTEPYIVLPHALLVNRLRFAEIARGKPVAEVLQHFNGTLGVIAKSSFVGFARNNFPQASIVEFDDWDAAVDAVSKGKITAAYRDAFEIKRMFKIKPDLVLTVRSVLIDDITDNISIAVGANSFHLQNYLNLFLNQNNIKYSSDQILSRYENVLQ
jgi:ABC-type amino acid transport substrate-binding protein